MDLEILNNALEILALAEEIHKNVENSAADMLIKREHEWPGYDEIYYFEHPKVYGKIAKRVKVNNIYIDNSNDNAEYYICLRVRYINVKGLEWEFAKVRIFMQNGSIKIMGRRTGSFEDEDFEDDDFFKKPDPELSLILESIKNSLFTIWEEIDKDAKKTTMAYDPKWVRQIIRQNCQSK